MTITVLEQVYERPLNVLFCLSPPSPPGEAHYSTIKVYDCYKTINNMYETINVMILSLQEKRIYDQSI
jgi:hypothetical protein